MWNMSAYPRNSCENIKKKGGLICSSDVQIQCSSLFPGHHQDCPVVDAHGGWLQCLDLTEKIPGSSSCREEDYGIHRDNVWVQNGCQGNFYTCYVPVVPPDPTVSRTLECRTQGKSYKQCKIDDAYLVKNVEMKIQINTESSCTEGINYGIVADSIFIKDGCSGVFTVDFYPESAAPPPVPPQPRTTTTRTTRRPTTTTTTFQTSRTQPTLFSPTTRSTSTTTNHTSILINSPPSSDHSGSIVALTAAAVLGVFLVAFIAVLATLWFSRRYRCTKRYLERKPGGMGTAEGPSGNIYEEISTNEEVPSAPPVYERQSFIANDFSGHECSLEPNNNPKTPLGENYFILDPKYRDCRTLPLNRNINPTNFEPEYYHTSAPDHRPCQIHRPVARMGSLGHNVHDPVIRMGTFNPKIHQYPLTLGPCLDPHVMHKQNTVPVLNGKNMRISDSDVDEDGYQKIGTFGPQQKHFQSVPSSFQSIPPNCNSVPPNINSFPANINSVPTTCFNVPQPHMSEQCQNSESNPIFFDTSSC